MKRFCVAAVLAVALFAGAGGVSALSTSLDSADITVVLRTDGKADIYYSLKWEASGGLMHGFYFQGEAFEPVWDMDGCYADLPGGVRQPLSIKALGSGKFDIVLAGGKGFSGNAYYFLHYAGDFAGSGLVGSSASPESGELLYFDWAPVEWDMAMDSRTVRLVLPLKVGGAALTDVERGSIPLMTEKSVNEENRMDFYGSKGGDGSHYLTIRFHQENLRARATQRLRLYFPAGYLPIATSQDGKAGLNETENICI